MNPVKLTKEYSDILKAVLEATSNLLPAKSRERYEKCYTTFCEWRNNKQAHGVDENIMLAYFFEKSKSLKASTLWSLYSMVKSTVQINENVDISKYAKLIAFLKRQNDGYEAKKSKILTMNNVNKFFSEAPDDSFLLIKVALIFALNGACRRGELYKLNVEDIEDTGSILVITLHDTKTKRKRILLL